MQRFTTAQLQAVLPYLRSRTDADGTAAYEMTFDELHRRMGDEAFDAWCAAQGW